MYEAVQVYEVELLPGDALELDVELRKIAIFTVFPASGRGPLTTRFDVLDEELAADIVTYVWDFNGDGVADSTDAAPSYCYTELGKHDVSLTVTLGDGTSGWDVAACEDDGEP